MLYYYYIRNMLSIQIVFTLQSAKKQYSESWLRKSTIISLPINDPSILPWPTPLPCCKDMFPKNI